MGFMSETVTVVGSSAYNLAGEPKDRGRYLKNTIMASILSGSSNGIGMDIHNAHVSGPGRNLKNYGKWAEKSGYREAMGIPTGFISRNNSISLVGLDAIVGANPAAERRVISSNYAAMDVVKIGNKWLLDNVPTMAYEPHTTEYEYELVREGGFRNVRRMTGNIILRFENGQVITARPVEDVRNPATVAYVEYEERPLVPPLNTDAGIERFEDESLLPYLEGYSGYYVPVQKREELNTVTKTVLKFSDDRPDEETETTSTKVEFVNTKKGIFRKTYVWNIGATSTDRTTSLTISFDYEVKIKETQTETEYEEDGVTVTKIVTENEEYVETFITVHTYHSDAFILPWGNLLQAVYVMGTSIAIDNVLNMDIGEEVGTYLPIIPLRIDNIPVNGSTYPSLNKLIEGAGKKAFGGKKALKKLRENLESNESIDDIDHAWAVFGVSLGSKEPESIEYLYRFFKDVSDSIPYQPGLITDPYAYALAIEAYWTAYLENLYPSDDRPRPPPPVLPLVRGLTFKTFSNIERFFGERIVENRWRYNIQITALGGGRTQGNGYNSRSKNKKGTAWIYIEGQVSVKNIRWESDGDGQYRVEYYETTDVVVFGKQITENLWEEYKFFNIGHTNNVYKGLSVETTAKQGLNGGENSGFLVPLNTAVITDTPLIPRAQLGMGSSYLVINYYDRQKIPWYASGLFKVILVIVVVIITIIFPPLGGSGAGLLGTNAAVGVALGAAAGTLTAVLLGAIVNALAAVIVASVINKVSTTLLGDKIGSIVGAIVSMVVIWAGSNNWNFNLDSTTLMTEMTKADNLLKLTMGGANMVSSHLGNKAAELVADSQSLLEDYSSRASEIADMAAQYVSGTDLDPRIIAEAVRNFVETPAQFLSRTLMTGDDIADASISIIEDFPKAQLALPLQGT